MNSNEARMILKKHASSYVDGEYEPETWVVDAVLEAAGVGQGLGHMEADSAVQWAYAEREAAQKIIRIRESELALERERNEILLRKLKAESIDATDSSNR